MTEYKSVSEFLKSRIRMVDDEADKAHLQRVRTWVRNWAFYRGNHYGDFDQNGRWIQLPDSQTEDLRYTDDFYFYVESKATQWSKSEPELSVEPTCKDARTKAAVRHIEKELINYRKEYWTPAFQQSMAKFAMLSTCYFIHTRPKLSDETVSIPEFSGKSVTSSGMVLCEKCGYSGNGDETKCPECGNPLTKMPGMTGNVSSASGVSKLPKVDIDIELVDPMEIKIDPKCRAGQVCTADYMRRERYIRRYDVDNMYPDWDKLKDNTSTPTQKSDILDYKRALEQGISGFNVDQKNDAENLLRRQYWFDLRVYKSFKIERDDEFAGVQFKSGDNLAEKYPKGLYIDQINGKHVKLFNENKNDRWVGSVDTIDPSSPYGRGFSGLVNLQEMLDEGVSLGFAYMMRDALGLQLYDPMMVESSDVETVRVGGAIPLKPGAQQENRPITAALINVENKPLSPFTIPFLQMIDSKMPHAAGGVYDVLGGGAGVGAGERTLGGQQQQLQTSASMIGPALQLRAQAEVDAFYQYLEHIQHFGSPEHYKRIAGEWDMGDAEAFSNIDIRKDINIFPIPNSEIPRTQSERRADVAIAIQSGLANPQMPMAEGIRRYGLNQLRIPIEDDPIEQGRRVGEMMLEKMRQASQYMSSIPNNGNPQVLAQGIAQVVPLVKQRDGDSLPIMKEVFQEALRAMVEDPEPDQNLEVALQLKIDEIEQMDVALATDLNAKQTMAQAPMAIAQAQLEAQSQPEGEDKGEAAKAQAEAQMSQASHEADLESQQSDLEAAHSLSEKAVDSAENQRQRTHDSVEADKQRKHDLAMAKIQAQQKARDAKAKKKASAKK